MLPIAPSKDDYVEVFSLTELQPWRGESSSYREA